MRFFPLAAVLLLSVLLCMSGYALAQTGKSPSAYLDSILLQQGQAKSVCGSDHQLTQLRKDPLVLAREQKMNEDILRVLNNQVAMNGGSGTSADPYVLPVVFHIVSSTDPNAITDAQIANAVKDLNDAFSKSGAYAASVGADTRIRFALAQTDPDGGLTKGITRIKSFYGDNMHMNLDDTKMKRLMQWDPVKYINIWLVKNIVGEISATFSCGVWSRMNAGGYATMPFSVNGSSPADGLVITGFGPLLAHEMGHYLGLYHTFEGYCFNNNCATDGDRVCDTPPDGSTSSTSCSSPTNSCNSDTASNFSNGFFPKDVPDQVSNFMDYGNTSCSNQFTEGQAARMRAAIATQRSGLINNLMNKPCADNVLASFTRDNANPKINDLVSFNNTSQNAASYEWLVDGVSRGTTANFSNTFTTAQKFKVTLKATHSSGCVSTATDYVLVNCGVTARFWNNKQLVASKTGVLNDTILFTNTSVGATSYQWIKTNNNGTGRELITSNAAGSGANNLNYVFPDPGFFRVKLIASDGACVDSTLDLFVNIVDPTPNAYVSIYSAYCNQQTKVNLFVVACNFGYAPILPGLPISFYDADPRLPGATKIDNSFILKDTLKGICCGTTYPLTLDVKRPGLNQLYAVVNDAGNVLPIVLPNTTLRETNYLDNVASLSNFRFRATVTPSNPVLRPGDTLRLSVQSSPDPTGSSTFLWDPAKQLSCTTCTTPLFTADSTRIKKVYAKSFLQCFDTATVNLTVVQPDDFTVKINTAECAGADSMTVNLTVNSQVVGAGIPKKLPIAIYDKDPSVAGAQLLPPLFLVPDSAFSLQRNYTFKVKKTTSGNVYAAVNPGNTAVPVSFSNPPFFEHTVTNNISAAKAYTQIVKVIDTAICRGDTLLGHTVSGTYTDAFVTSGGCDSLRILNLTIRPVAVTKTTFTVNICAGQSHEGYTKSGTYVNVFKGANSCDSIRTLILTVYPHVSRTNTVQICKGDTYLAGGKLQTTAGTYVDSLKTSIGCDSVVTTILTVVPVPLNFLPLDTTLCIGKTLPIVLSYPTTLWSDGSSGNFFNISQTGSYTAQVVDRNGCKGTDSIQVQFNRCIAIQIPDAFSPNNDGKNDVFKPLIGAPITNYRMQIWNRWGQLVFETRDISKGWDGKYLSELQQNGAYIYYFTLTDPDGVFIEKKGTLILIR
jgi:gliding motility-associated-like protein